MVSFTFTFASISLLSKNRTASLPPIVFTHYSLTLSLTHTHAHTHTTWWCRFALLMSTYEVIMQLLFFFLVLSCFFLLLLPLLLHCLCFLYYYCCLFLLLLSSSSSFIVVGGCFTWPLFCRANPSEKSGSSCHQVDLKCQIKQRKQQYVNNICKRVHRMFFS